jgi:integrase
MGGRPMTLSRAVDLHLGDLQRAGRRPRTLDAYRRHLNILIDVCEDRGRRRDIVVSEVEPDDCRSFLDRWSHCAPATICKIHSAANGLFEWLYQEGRIEANPMDRIKRPRRPNPGDVDVVEVSPADVEKIFEACEDLQEFLCVAVLAYTGIRRDSASRLRWEDVDLVEGRMKRRNEKGGKTIDAPIPNELQEILKAAIESGEVACGPRDYVIPHRRAATVKNAERTNKVVYETLKTVATRAGVQATAHAMRRAFAVNFMRSHPGAIESLQALLGHSRIDTTEAHYLRAFDRSERMESVRNLSWAAAPGFSSHAPGSAAMTGKAHTGFEPVPPP